MRYFLVFLVSGCVTSGSVRQAQEDHISCLDNGIAMMKEAQRQREVLFEWQEAQIPCDVRAAYGLEEPPNCPSIKQGASKLAAQVSSLEASIETNRATCEELKYRADDLRDEHDRQAASLSAAAQAYGDGLKDAAAIQAQRRPTPMSCTTVLIGNIATTSCN